MSHECSRLYFGGTLHLVTTSDGIKVDRDEMPELNDETVEWIERMINSKQAGGCTLFHLMA